MESERCYQDINNINEENEYLFPDLEIEYEESLKEHMESDGFSMEYKLKLQSDLIFEENFLSGYDFDSWHSDDSFEYPKKSSEHTLTMNFTEPSEDDPVIPESSSQYFQSLNSLRVQMSDTDPKEPQSRQPSLSTRCLARITKEISALSKSLPCESTGSIFCRFSSSNLSMIHVLISGTEGTPYENGLYLFKVRLLKDYPLQPPIVHFETTGNGKVRFSPNLYSNGFVCLSIINTWGGSPDEKWNPNYSTLLQVFISIQSLVMNSSIVQKEPGYETMSDDCEDNKSYTLIVKYGNLAFAMLEMIKHPPDGFKEVVIKHFTLQKQKILENCSRWVEETRESQIRNDSGILLAHNPAVVALFRSKGVYDAFYEIYRQLEAELNKL